MLTFFTQIEKFHHKYILYKVNKKTTLEEIYKLSELYDEILIDPGVYELKKLNEYSQIDKLHSIVNLLPKNVFLSIDYPCDMNPLYTELFIQKSIDNNFKYATIDNYICTIQSKFMDFEDFILRFKELSPIFESNKNKIIGIGNICRLVKTKEEIEFGKKVIRFLSDNLQNRRIHIYGLGFKLIRSKEFKILCETNYVSIDSTKWTRALKDYVKKLYGLNALDKDRIVFFYNYMYETNKLIEVDF